MTIYIIISAVVLFAFVFIFVAYKQSENIISKTIQRSKVNIFPDQMHLAFENVIFKNKDGITLKGWFLPAQEESGKTIVFMHGWGMNKGSLLKNTVFLNKKYNLFYFDFCGAGESGDGKSSVGYIEVRDAASAIEKLLQTRPEAAKTIGLYGIDSGAACAIYCGAGNSAVKCVLAEGCFCSAEQVAIRRKKAANRFLCSPVLKLALYFAKRRSNIKPQDFSPDVNITKLAGKALLIINGADDTLAPRKDAMELFALAKDPKELWIVPNASHTTAAEVAVQQYKNRLEEFFNKNL